MARTETGVDNPRIESGEFQMKSILEFIRRAFRDGRKSRPQPMPWHRWQ